MKELGVIKHYTKTRLFIVEAKEKLPLNTVIVDSRGKPYGEIIDVIGPITNPYLIVKPLVEKPEKYVGSPVYYVKRRRK